MKKTMKTPLATAMGVALISTLSATVQAETFAANELPQGYMQLAAGEKSGEMACGANMGGMEKPKAPEGACAGKKTETKKAAEASCGAMMEDGKMKKGMEGVCGEMMKGKEGACGTLPAGEKAKEGACGTGKKTPETKTETK